MWAAILKGLAVILQPLLTLLLARQDAKADERREIEAESLGAALQRERTRDEVDTAARGDDARKRLRAKYTRRD